MFSPIQRNFAYWNIHGLNAEKFGDDMLISSVCKYDIVCFAETMLRDFPVNLPSFSSPYKAKPIKHKNRSRCLSLKNLNLKLEPLKLNRRTFPYC